LDNGTDKGRAVDGEVGAGGRIDGVRVLAAYDEGVKAIQGLSPAVADWNASTPCAAWRCVDLAGHVLCVARYYHRLLDAAVTGHPLSGLPRGEALAVMNGQDLIELPETSGPERIRDFGRTATAYRDRLRAQTGRRQSGPGVGIGRLTIAEHILLAVGEWHIHAWDLARAAGGDHQPADAEVVLAGLRILPGSLPDGEPWAAALQGAGRLRSRRVGEREKLWEGGGRQVGVVPVW